MLKVYMVGLIYLNGCAAIEKRIYAPDGRPGHKASLWVAADDVDEDATEWPERESHEIDPPGGGAGTVSIVEFRIDDPTELFFPDQADAPVTCSHLEKELPKLKKKQNGAEVDFEIDAAAAQTIAEVHLRGGDVRGRRYKNIGVGEWTIDSSSTLEITDNRSRRITLKNPIAGAAAEVVFSNVHDPFAEGDQTADHVEVFTKLDPADPSAILIAKKASGKVGQVKTENAFLAFLRKNAHTEGETPGCCCVKPPCLGTSLSDV